MEFPTEEQLEYIRDIEDYFGVTFVGKTRQEAELWISEYDSQYKEELEKEKNILNVSMIIQKIKDFLQGD